MTNKHDAAAKKALKPITKRIAQKSVNVAAEKLELLVTVVGRNKAEFFADLIQSFEVNMQMITMAEGTADAKMLGMLGLTDNAKVVIFSVIKQKNIPEITNVLAEKFRTIKNGKGIAYTIPLSSVIGTLIYGFLSNNRMAVKE